MKFRTPIQVNWKTALKRAGISCLFVLIIAGIASPNSALESNLNCPTESLTSSFSLCQAPPIAQNSTQNSQEIQAQQLYQQGKFQESRLLLDQAITTYKAQGDRPGTARALRNLGLVYLKTQNWSDAQEAISQALVLLAELPNSKTIQHLQGSTLEAQGQLYLLTNRPEQALETWKTTATTYQEIQDWTGWVRSQINQSQALQTLGLYTQALKKLVAAQTQLAQEPDSILKAKALQSLGDVLRGVGRLDGAQAALEQSLILANQLQDPEQSAVTLISLGNTFRQKNQIDQSLESYREAVQATDSPELKLQAQLNQLSLFIQNQQVQPALDLLPAIEALLDQLSPSTSKVQSQINLAQSLIDARNLETSPEIRQNPKISKLQIANYLTAAIQLAETLNDSRSQAYALGLLGNLYESNQQFNEAQQLTEKALILAQGINATDIAYRWQWQLGRIATAKQDRKTAISAYTQAVNNLKSLRSDIVAISSTVQFGFREQVEPVYRELVGLLLAGEPTQDDLKKARDVLESLQVAELDNFFRDACLDTRPVNIEEIDPLAAIFYTILLPDYLAVIVTLPDQSLNYHRIDLSRAEIEMGLQKLTEAITIPRERVFIENFLEPSQQVYQWLVGSFAEILTANTIQTLVFVLDSQMRNIPVASLYDGENYLMEKYNVAIAPSLQLTDLADSSQKQQVDVLGGGVSVARQGFPPLPAVELELAEIRRQIKQTNLLLNEAFTETQVNTALTKTPYTVVHLATHGEFSSSAEETFVLTWDERINIDDLRRLLSADFQRLNPIELIILSACQTAVGDDRAGLGLAGIAVRAGARSTIASLWSVDDESTALLMGHFYEALNRPGITKSQALRFAQQQLLQNKAFNHPYFWSAFVLVGNWL